MKNRFTNKLSIIFITIIYSISITSFSVTAEPVYDHEDYKDEPFVIVNDNKPDFTKAEMKNRIAYEVYGELDELGRCTAAEACVGKELMPTEERGQIGSVKPSGWQSVKYECVEGKYLYNRCHLIGYQLTAENANERNLITGTRYLNVEGMLPFENMVADYIKETNNHVFYRVTPIFEDDDLVAEGVTIEAYSIEDKGDGICFNVFCFNVQPGITIDYKTGESFENGNTEAVKNTKSTKKYKMAEDSSEEYNFSDVDKKELVIGIVMLVIFCVIYYIRSREKKR